MTWQEATVEAMDRLGILPHVERMVVALGRWIDRHPRLVRFLDWLDR